MKKKLLPVAGKNLATLAGFFLATNIHQKNMKKKLLTVDEKFCYEQLNFFVVSTCNVVSTYSVVVRTSNIVSTCTVVSTCNVLSSCNIVGTFNVVSTYNVISIPHICQLHSVIFFTESNFFPQLTQKGLPIV